MKKQLLTSLLALTAATSVKAAVVNDSVTLGASYVNQVWYSLANDEKGTKPRAEWDLAFNLIDISSPILINSRFSLDMTTFQPISVGVTLWNYPKGDTSAWSSIDTAGLSTWKYRTNYDTSWASGAMGNYANPANMFDLDWGKYDMGTHYVIGDSIYIVKLPSGDYKKLWMKHLKSGTFTFVYANLDGSSEQVATIKKSDYANKNFAYYSIKDNKALDREPASDAWDLTFVNYTTDYPSGPSTIPYNVTGVLHNMGVRVAQANNIANKATYVNYAAHPFQTAINAIGYDWKTTSPPLTAKDSLVYFVEDVDQTIWKLIFTGTVGSADGIIRFSKEAMATTSVKNTVGETVAKLALYPNPAVASQATNIVYSFETNNSVAKLNVYDMAGRVVYTAGLETGIGLHTTQLPANTLAPGMYVITVQTDNAAVQQRMIIK